ncbi:hypothetical protein DFH07DRAFT_952655 [Mycena maculata]|uniref:Uncharacterized protein n=1 Tax=Mycena maculata TaxID=230809 RepID=A0AAD7NSR1_9AGAR|nr:hypothetical protein DFH07DRAFT_952655 [Mycena maculata]
MHFQAWPNCQLITGTPHPRANAPEFEQRYRGIAGYIIRTDRREAEAATATGTAIVPLLPPGTAINFVETTEQYPAHYVVLKSLCDKAVVVPGAKAARSGEEGRAPNDIHTSASMYSEADSINISDLYSVERRMSGDVEAVPFTQTVQLNGLKGRMVGMRGTFDDGAMVNAIDTGIFNSSRGSLVTPRASVRILRMANGALIRSDGCWRGTITVDGISATGSFEILPSGSAWQVLVGKPMLQTFKALHDYTSDEVTLRADGG